MGNASYINMLPSTVLFEAQGFTIVQEAFVIHCRPVRGKMEPFTARLSFSANRVPDTNSTLRSKVSLDNGALHTAHACSSRKCRLRVAAI